MHDFSDNGGAAASSSRVAVLLAVVGLHFVQSGEGKRDGLGDSSLLFLLHSHRYTSLLKESVTKT